MTEIKIPFTKKSIRQIPADQLRPGTKGVELEIQTDFHMESLASLQGIVHGPISDAPFEKLAFVFTGNDEQVIYDALSDSKNQSFELSFDKEKVFLNVDGFGNFIDKTKPEINMRPGDKSLVVFFESKFAGIIKLAATSQGPNIPTNDQQKITQLQAQIAELEEKLRRQPNNEEDEKEIKRLQDELEKLKQKNNPQQSNKDNFPYGLAIGGGDSNFSINNGGSGSAGPRSVPQ